MNEKMKSKFSNVKRRRYKDFECLLHTLQRLEDNNTELILLLRLESCLYIVTVV